MGDISEMRALIVLVTIVTTFIGLLAVIPSDFYTSSLQNSPQPNLDINAYIAWNDTYVCNMTYTAYAAEIQNLQINGYNLAVGVYGKDDTPTIAITSYAQWAIFIWDVESFDWYDSSGVEKSSDFTWTTNTFPAISAAIIDTYDVPQEFEIRNSKTKFNVAFVYNTTTYSSFTDALKDDAASIVFNINWEDRSTSMNALQLVGMILTGTLPQTDASLSVIFGIIGWAIVAAGAYLLFIFLLRLAGAIFGGGGA